MSYPRVTQILSWLNPITSIDSQTLSIAAERGTAIHAAIAEHLRGGFPCPPETAIGYWQSYEKLKIAINPIEIEKRYQCQDFRYQGGIDLVCLIDGKKTIIDWKTGQESQSWPLQLAAYWHLAGGAERLMAIQLKSDGANPSIHEYQPGQYWNLFLSCLNVYNYFKGERNGN